MTRVLAFAVLVSAVACDRVSPPATPLPPVPPAVDDAIAADADDDAPPFIGVVLAGETVDIAARSDGRIDALMVKPGDRVHQGQVLAVLDRRLLRKSLSVARAELAEAEERYQRRVPLKAEATISREELSVSRMQVLEQRSRLDQLSQALNDAELRAPFDGTVAARFVDRGALTVAGRPIVRLISASVPRVRFAVPASIAGSIAVTNDVTVAIEGLTQPVAARVESVAPEVDSAARMIFAVALLAPPPSLRERIRSGQVAHVQPLGNHGGG